MEVSEKRTKLDCFPVMENENSQCKTQCESLSSDSTCNLRKSIAWDSAFFTSPGVLDPEELFATLNFTEKKSSPHDSSEIVNISPIGWSNARTSLAWDSAFFTNAGVLDQEELSLVNKGFGKCESHHLPGIKEVWRSADSNSTIDSDGFSLSSLEIDLFGDLRASMDQASKVSESSILSSKLGRTAPKSLHTSSQVRVKPMHPSRRQDISKKGPLPPRRQTKLCSQTGESNMLRSIRPPRVACRTTSPLATSTGRPYLSANQVKLETNAKKESAGECMSVSKKPCLEDSPSMASPTAANNYAVFTSPSPNSNDTQSNSMRRKVNSRPAVCSSNSKTPLSSARNRSGLVRSSLPNHVLSTPKSSSTISPATSCDGWSSESSSTSVKRKSVDSSARLDTIPCGLPRFENDSSQLFDSAYHRGPRPPYSCTDVLRNGKPSCLRKPSPKIGFFDEEQYNALELKGYRNFDSSIRSSRTSNLNGECSKTRFGKKQLSGSSVGNTKTASWQSRVSCPSAIRPAHGSDNAFLVLSSRDCLKTHGVGASCDVERKGTLVSRKRNKIARVSEGQGFLRSSKQSSKEPEEAHDSDKENIVPLENQVEDLSRHIQAIDLSKTIWG